MIEPHTSHDYDIAHKAGTHPLMGELFDRAFGADRPSEVDPFSSCTWWTLGQAVATLRVPAGGLLADLGCGRGGPGLWLARALSARLVGVDFSPVAVALATERAADFVPPGRAEFHVGTFADTGLPDGIADGAISVDALPFAPDRAAALAELHRILAPGARAVITVAEVADPGQGPRGTWSQWLTHLAAAGLRLERRLEDYGRNERWHALYALWLRHEADLRAAVGDEATNALIAEASDADRLNTRRPVLLVLRRP
ncbi:MAG TPA: class I SAM-dependent methyltransferase [Pseudonocardiaceae bacterium]|nr:class I SAM-dependent methyltransferase [Pseudonocardiaceae bacterium]